MVNFLAFPTFTAGAVIGLAILILWLFVGRVACAGGILCGLRRSRHGDLAWRLFFVAGLLFSPLIYRLFVPGKIAASVTPSPALLVAAGVLVGFGSAAAGGSGSAHGVFGIATGSPRAVVVSALIIGAAVTTVFVIRHLGQG